MEVQPASQPSQATQSPAQSASNGALSSDFETFLRMLTTQMENQDPLNPIESADFAVQLATFSGVEQQIRTNDLLQSMVDGVGASGLGQLAGWVGMEVRVAAPAYFDGAPIDLAPEPDPASDAARLLVFDAAGREVAREWVPLGAPVLSWAGVGTDGAPLPPGQYTFELESLNSGEVTSRRSVDHYGAVQEARIGAEGLEIVLAGGTVLSSSAAKALRAPAGI